MQESVALLVMTREPPVPRAACVHATGCRQKRNRIKNDEIGMTKEIRMTNGQRWNGRAEASGSYARGGT